MSLKELIFKNQIENIYRPEINGIRALAVIFVIIYHFNNSLIPGGFLGVDIFFVISGYVITSSFLKNEVKSFGGFLKNFYIRRITRLAPALIFYTLIASIFICFFDDQPNFSLRTGIASLFGLSNIYLIKSSMNYFNESSNLNIFTHTWSLALEAQFYLIFPFLTKLSNYWSNHKNKKINLFNLFLLLTISSLIFYIFLFKGNNSLLYYFMPSRFWEIGYGCLICLTYQNYFRFNNDLRRISTSLVFFLLLLFIFLPNENFQLTRIIIVFLSGILILVLKKEDYLSRLLTRKFLLKIGDLSYSLYLWHWGVITISLWTIGINKFTIIFQVIIIYLLSNFTFKYIEKENINGFEKLNKKLKKRFWFSIYFLTLSTLYLLDSSFNKFIYLGKINQIEELNDKFLVNAEKNCFKEDLSNLKINFEKLNDFCIKKSKNKKNFLLIGDSQSHHLLPIFAKLNLENNNGIFYKAIPAITLPTINYSTKEMKLEMIKNANSYLNQVLDLFMKNSNSGDIVIFSSRQEIKWSGKPLSIIEKDLEFEFYDENDLSISEKFAFIKWKENYKSIVDQITKKNLNIIIFSSFPSFNDSYIPPSVINPQWFNKLNKTNKINYISRKLLKNRYSKVDNFLSYLAKTNNNVFYFDIFDELCPSNQEFCFQDSRYKDYLHFSREGSLSIYRKFKNFLKTNDLIY